MADTWEFGLAKMFKDRDNPTNTPIGPCLGKVLSINPVKIQIQDGNFIIQGPQVYVAYHLLERETNYDSLVGSMNGSINIDCHPCSGSYNGNITSTGHIHLNEVWKVGDLVVVLPSASEQQFFILDIVRPIAGCNGGAE